MKLSAPIAGVFLFFPGGSVAPEGGRGRRSMMDDKKRITAEIRDYLARQRISREQFAFKTKLGKSTVDKLLTGLFSDRTLAIVESHTGLKLREKPDAASSAAAPARR